LGNTRHSMFSLLQEVVDKYFGVDLIVTQVLDRMGTVEKMELLSDYAKGIDSGTIEINITGKNINTEYTQSIIPKIEDVIKRKVIFYYNEKDKNGIVLFGE